MYRYEQIEGITSSLDPLHDVLGLVQYLASIDYLKDVLINVHSISNREAKERGKLIVPYVKSSLDLLEQSFSGRDHLSFLPAYYAILNMMKVYVLLGPHAAQLSKQSRHGATHASKATDCKSVLTETIQFKAQGAIPLFYSTVTGHTIPLCKVRIGDLLPYIQNVGAEYCIATKQRMKLAQLHLTAEITDNGMLPIIVAKTNIDNDYSDRRKFKILKDTWHKYKSMPTTFSGELIPSDSPLYHTAKQQLNAYMIYRSHYTLKQPARDNGLTIVTPFSGRMLLLPEELPIALLFFHMSNVVRYRPDILAKLCDSRYWPIYVAARRHCVYAMLCLFWSFVHKKELIIDHPN